jgi:signal peptidase II
MTLSRKKRLLIFLAIGLVVVLLDQVSKHLISSALPLNSGFEAAPGFLNIVHVRNPGAAFGLFSHLPPHLRSYFFLGISITAVLGILSVVALSQEITLLTLLGLSFFFAGALGNFLDRIRFGEVVDFLDFHIGVYHWPAFNVADMALCLGTGFFVIHCLFKPREN